MSLKPNILQKIVAFNHLVELRTVNRWLAAFILGVFYFIEVFKVPFNPSFLAMGLVAISFILFYVMSINDTFDVEDDKIKSKITGKKMVVSEEISVKDALLMSLIMLISGLTISLFVSPSFLLIVLVIVTLSTLYSVPPIRYKRIFPFSTLGEFLGAFMPFLAGYAVLGAVDFRAFIVSAFFALTSQYWRFFHETLFCEVDRKLGKATFAVVYGPKVSKNLGRLCLSIAVIESVVLFGLGTFSLQFSLLLALYLLLSLGFWYWFIDYIPPGPRAHVKNLLGPTWGVLFLAIVIVFIIL